MTEIFIILACVPLYVVNAFCDKHISTQNGGVNNTSYNTLKFFIGAAVLLPFLFFDGAPKFKAGAIICGALCGVMYAISKGLILKGYELTSVSFMTLCHASGMIIPCVVGHFIWSEKLGIISLLGVLLTVVAVVLLKNGKGSGKALTYKGVLIGLAVFLSSGGIMVLQKLMAIYFSGESVSAYNFYSFLVGALIMLTVCYSGRRVRKEKDKQSLPLGTMLLCAFGSSLSLGIISLVMTALAGAVPSVVLFPLFNGSGIILVCIGSVFVFKEKMTVKQYIGLFVGVLGLCVVNM